MKFFVSEIREKVNAKGIYGAWLNNEEVLWLLEEAEKAERYESALLEIVAIGHMSFRTESEVLAETVLAREVQRRIQREKTVADGDK